MACVIQEDEQAHVSEPQNTRTHTHARAHAPLSEYGYRPVAHSSSVMPRLQTSAGCPYSRFLIRSGLMYLKVPTNVAHIAIEFWSSALSPKSLSLTNPCELISTFDGLMSRCTRRSVRFR